MRRLVLMLLAMTSQYAMGQLAQPTFSSPSGTYVNMVWTYMQSTAVAGVFPKICWTKDGSAPTATVAGTCDNNGVIWTTDGNVASASFASAEFDGAGTYALKAIATLAGQTNSSVGTANYTVTSTPALGLLTWTTPTQKITASSPGTNYYMPTVVTAPSGRVWVWFGAGPEAPDHGKAGRIELRYSDDNGLTWNDYAPSTVTSLFTTNIGSGYTTSACSIAPPVSGVTATCTVPAPVNGAIPSITLTSPGTGYDVTQIPLYTHPIIVTATGGGCTVEPTAQAWVNDTSTHAIAGVRMATYGSGCSSAPACAITQVGNAGTATCTFGNPVAGAIISPTLTNRGTGYTSPPAVTISGIGGTGAAVSATLNNCEPGDPARCFWHDSAYGQEELMGGGITYNNTMIVTGFDTQLSWNTSRGPRIWRSTDNGSTWGQSFNVQLAPTQTHSPANLLSIPPASPGVTGPCAAGCLIQWTTEGGSGNANFTMKSFDDGVTWSTLLAVPNNFPQNDEETAIAWIGGMQLLAYTRNTRSASNNIGWPVPLMVHKSSDLGATWTQVISNLPTGPCTGLNPNSYFWSDQFTKPSGFVNPNNPAQFTFMYGERFGCASAATSDTRWRTVTFNMASAFSGTGQNTPLPQTLALAPFGLAYGTGHTSYSGAWPMANNKVLMAWEQAASTTAEDVFVSQFSYPATPSLTITSTSPLPNGTATVPYNVAINASGGIPAYTWSVTAGNLAPCGLSLTSGGIVTGATPVTGVCNFTAQVTDTVAASTTKPFTVTIVDPFGIRFSGGIKLK